MATIEVKSEIAGVVWKVLVAQDAQVSEDETLVILESMKMEIPVTAPEDGVVKEIWIQEGSLVAEREVLLLLQTG